MRQVGSSRCGTEIPTGLNTLRRKGEVQRGTRTRKENGQGQPRETTQIQSLSLPLYFSAFLLLCFFCSARSLFLFLTMPFSTHETLCCLLLSLVLVSAPLFRFFSFLLSHPISLLFSSQLLFNPQSFTSLCVFPSSLRHSIKSVTHTGFCLLHLFRFDTSHITLLSAPRSRALSPCAWSVREDKGNRE